MRRRRCVCAVAAVAAVAAAVLAVGASALPTQRRGGLTHAQSNYLLACGGCHGFAGSSNDEAVPDLQGLVGFYLNTPEGRAYLPRLPNVAFAPISDAELAAVLNYVVFDLGGASVPAGAQPYGAAEVGRWRARPLTEVALSAYRRQLVATLVSRHGASAKLQAYAPR